MSYSVIAIRPFDRQIKQLIKKYPSLKAELAKLILSLEDNPTQGTLLHSSCYKIRLSISSKGKGKSGGARVITYLQVVNETVFLLSIYENTIKALLKTYIDKYI